MSELIGRKLGQYEITALLGEGGMATVYRAHQESMGRDVAIKIIESKLARNPEFSKRFDREARTIAALSHSHILKVFDYGRQDDLIYLVMELLPGGSLTDLIKRKPLDLPDAVRLLDQVGDALDYAHGLGIIHRDLKPQNVLLDARGNAILTDFGIAKLLNETTALTHSGIAMGTPFYMSPEQCQGGTIDARSDLYALGIMLFEMLTGDVPFKSDTPISLLYMHINQTPPSVRQNRPDLPEAVELVIRKALAKQPAARFQSAGEMVAAFRTAITGVMPAGLEETEPPGERTARTPVPAIPAARVRMPHEETQVQPVQRSGRTMLVLGALALVALVGIAVVLLSGRGGGEVTPITAAVSATVPVIAANPTEAAVPVLSSTFTFTATDNPTQTPAPSLTSTFTSTVTDTATETFTSTATDTATLTETSVPSLTPTETLDPIQAAETIYFSGLTLTATQWTLTPSPNFTETVGARLTEMAVTAYTQTPTPSDTPTFTLTPTVTFTITLTPTDTVTATLTPTFTYTPTSTYTPAYTPTVTLTPAPTLIPAGTSNTVWTPVERDFNGIPMVYVPAGCFMMGSTETQIDYVFELAKQSPADAKRESFDKEKPAHQVCIDQPFWIDRTEVTQAQFTAFGGKASLAPKFAGSNRPREHVTWFEARDFCSLRGTHLPTEVEWEYAARGPESLIFPWGNTFDGSKAVYNVLQTAEVGSKPSGASWVGALDMGGSLWEWISSQPLPYPYQTNDGREVDTGIRTDISRGLRGGSWGDFGFSLTTSNRGMVSPDNWNQFFGFRCARASDDSLSLSTTPAPVSTSIAAAATPIPVGTSNTVWTTVERDFDGVTMVLVPTGCFMMGSTDVSTYEQPVHEVCFEQPFWIDKYEVTIGQFNDFSGQAAQPSYWKDEDRPREQITWIEAEAFCTKRRIRLPTEAEWEYAVRGPEGLIYPWGNTFVDHNVVYFYNSGNQSAKVGSRPGGVSWVGAYDMSGNIFEWVADRYDEYYYTSSPKINPQGPSSGQYHVLRGGSWINDDSTMRGAGRSRGGDLGSSFMGFRCARSYQ